MIVTRLHELVATAVSFSNLDKGNLLLKEVRYRKMSWLTLSVRHLNAKANAQVVTSRGVQS